MNESIGKLFYDSACFFWFSETNLTMCNFVCISLKYLKNKKPKGLEILLQLRYQYFPRNVFKKYAKSSFEA